MWREQYPDLKPKDIKYDKDGFLYINDVKVSVEHPRLEFAKALSEFPENNAAWEVLQSGTQIHLDTVIGDNVEIGYYSIIGDRGFGYVRDEKGELFYIHHLGHVIISDNVTIRSFCTIDRGVVGNTFIGTGTKIDHHCHFAHSVFVGTHNTFADSCSIEGSCIIGDYNTFGTHVVVQKGIRIGNNCVIGSNTIVTKDVPNNSKVYGNPGRII